MGAMSSAELALAIASPAITVGCAIEPELVSQIIREMDGEPGALPLMSFALKELFAEESRAGIGQPMDMSLPEYNAIGGINGALESYTKSVFEIFDKDQIELAKLIFKKLVKVGKEVGEADTRRTPTLAELIPAGSSRDAVEKITNHLSGKGTRLLTISMQKSGTKIKAPDYSVDQIMVTIAHEKLISAWPWLKELVDHHREEIVLLNQIHKDAQAWSTHRQDEGFLYRGGRLAQIEEQLDQLLVEMSALSSDFVQASISRRKQLKEAEEAQRQRELKQAQELAEARRIQVEEAQKSLAAAQAQNLLSLPTILGTEKALKWEEAERNLLFVLQAMNIYNELGGPIPNRALADRQIFSSINVPDYAPYMYDWRVATSEIETLAFCPHRGLLAAAGNDHKILLWDSESTNSSPPITLEGHTDTVYSIAFSPDGNMLLSTSRDKSIRLWSLDDLSPQFEIQVEAESEEVVYVLFSPDGKYMVTGRYVWEVNDLTAPLIDLQETHKLDLLTSGAFSPDGEILAVGGYEGNVYTFAMSDIFASPEIYHGHTGTVTTLTFSFNGLFIVSGSYDSSIRMWVCGDPSATPIILEGHEKGINTIASSPDGRWLISGSEDHTIRLWDLLGDSTKTQSFVLDEHNTRIRAITFVPESEIFFSAGGNQTIFLWQLPLENSMSIAYRSLFDEDIISVFFSPDGEMVAVPHFDATIHLWDIPEGHIEPIILEGHAEPAFQVIFSPNKKTIVTAGLDNVIYLWDKSDLQTPKFSLKGATELVSKIHLSPDEQTLFGICEDHKLRLWNLLTPQALPIVLEGHTQNIVSIAVSPDGKTLASTGTENVVRVWDLSTPQSLSSPTILAGHSDLVLWVEFSPDGKMLATAGQDNLICLWDLSNLQSAPEILDGHKEPVRILAFSPDSKTLVSASNYIVNVWDLSAVDPTPVTLRGEAAFADDIVFSPDGRTIALVIRMDKVVRFWDLSNLKDLPMIRTGHKNDIWDVVFLPNGKLISVSKDGTVRIWPTFDGLLETATLNVTRNLTWEEWQEYLPGRPYAKTLPLLPVHPSVPESEWPEEELVEDEGFVVPDDTDATDHLASSKPIT